MSTKHTPQEIYQALRCALRQVSPEVQTPEHYENLSEEIRVLIREIAWRLNLIESEYEHEKETSFKEMAWKMNLIASEFDLENVYTAEPEGD